MSLPRWILVGLVSGVVSVFLFQQNAVRLLPMLGLHDDPVVWPLAVWGGIWGALLAGALARLEGKRLVLAATAFGALLPTLVTVLLLAAFRGQPVVTGIVPLAILVAALVNAAWGLGTGIGLALFGRPGLFGGSDRHRREA